MLIHHDIRCYDIQLFAIVFQFNSKNMRLIFIRGMKCNKMRISKKLQRGLCCRITNLSTYLSSDYLFCLESTSNVNNSNRSDESCKFFKLWILLLLKRSYIFFPILTMHRTCGMFRALHRDAPGCFQGGWRTGVQGCHVAGIKQPKV